MWELNFTFFLNIIRPHHEKSGNIRRQQHRALCSNSNAVQLFCLLAVYCFPLTKFVSIVSTLIRAWNAQIWQKLSTERWNRWQQAKLTLKLSAHSLCKCNGFSFFFLVCLLTDSTSRAYSQSTASLWQWTTKCLSDCLLYYLSHFSYLPTIKKRVQRRV